MVTGIWKICSFHLGNFFENINIKSCCYAWLPQLCIWHWWRWLVSFMLQLFYSQRNNPQSQWTGGWDGPRAGVDPVARRKNPSHCRESNFGRPARSLVTIMPELLQLLRLLQYDWLILRLFNGAFICTGYIASNDMVTWSWLEGNLSWHIWRHFRYSPIESEKSHELPTSVDLRTSRMQV